jgi:predicted ATPase
LNKVKDPPSADDGFSARLSWNGENLWAVLRAWKGAARRYEHRFEWVVTQARRAFPDLIKDLEFDDGQASLYRPGSEVGLPAERAPDGLLTGLLHLTAIAGMPEGGLVAFDEIEGQLHPHAIRSILRALRARAEEKKLTAIITTHSPVVMNDFLDEPEQVFVLQPRADQALVPLTELHTEEWLAQRKLGTLYEDLGFAAPDQSASS